jgi:hypothetical protein
MPTAQDNAVFANHKLQWVKDAPFRENQIVLCHDELAVLKVVAPDYSTILPILQESVGYKSHRILPDGSLQVSFGR